MKKLVLIGGGGHCKSVLDAALRTKEYDEIVITDAELPIGTKILGCKVVGDDSILSQLYQNNFRYAFITVGSVKSDNVREKIMNKIALLGFRFPVIIDETAVVSKFAVIGDGTFIGKNAIVNADANIGAQAIVNTGAIIEHDCKIENFCHVSVGATLCGNVSVGKYSFIGAGSTIIQGIHIGENVTIGSGSTVIKSVENGRTSYGLIKD